MRPCLKKKKKTFSLCALPLSQGRNLHWGEWRTLSYEREWLGKGNKAVKDHDMLMTPRQYRNGRHQQTLHRIKWNDTESLIFILSIQKSHISKYYKSARTGLCATNQTSKHFWSRAWWWRTITFLKYIRKGFLFNSLRKNTQHNIKQQYPRLVMLDPLDATLWNWHLEAALSIDFLLGN